MKCARITFLSGIFILMTNEKLTTKEWVKQCKAIHGDAFDYSNSNYINSKTLIIISCPIHGEIKVNPNRHKTGSGCKRCSSKKKSKFKSLSKKVFIKEASVLHNNKYDYTLTEDFNNSHEKVTIICPEHGEFKQAVYAHRNGKGCKKCSYEERGLKKRVTKKEFIKKCSVIHNNKYNYEKTVFEKTNDIINIICPHHGEFKQKAKDHYYSGCSLCGKIYSSYTFEKDDNFVDIAKELNSGVYLLKFKDFYKIGITKEIRGRINLITSRLNLDYKPKTIIYKKTNLFDAVNIESQLHSKYSDYHYIYPTFFEGQTECFTTDLPIEEIKEYLKNN